MIRTLIRHLFVGMLAHHSETAFYEPEPAQLPPGIYKS